MNYFAHGRAFVDQPYFLAGTALPDWLSVVDRKVRVRRPAAQRAARLGLSTNATAMARGIVRHHDDDDWFHRTAAFAELASRFCLQIRDALGDDTSLGPHFLGHILVELLLDAALLHDEPDRLRAYYAALESVDRRQIVAAVEQIGGAQLPFLPDWIDAFCRERFLYDYLDDAKLIGRIGQVLRRVGLPPIAGALAAMLPRARDAVAARRDELLTPAEPCGNWKLDAALPRQC